MLRFSELLQGQVQNEIPYSALKNLLRALRSNHPLYPHRSADDFSQAQTQTQTQTQTPCASQLSLPFLTPQNVRQDMSQDMPYAEINDLQPKTLFPAVKNPGETPSGSLQVHREENDGNADKGQHDVSDAEEELKTLVQRVADATSLSSQHAHLIGIIINAVVQYLAEDLRLSGKSGEVSLRDIAKFFCDKSDPVYDFLEAMCLRNFKQEDVVAAVSNGDAGAKSIAVFYSVQFWMSLWTDYLAEAMGPFAPSCAP